MSRTKGYARTGRDYAQIDVLAADHPKVARLSDPGFRAWIESILYCHSWLRWLKGRAS